MNYKQGRITWCIILFFIFIFMLLFGINIVNKENILQSSYAVEIIDDITLKQKTISDYDCSIYITKAMLGQYIELHTINASVTASVDNKTIYEEEKVDAKNKELKYVCSRWHFIEIKPAYIGKEMIISLNTNNVIRENIKIYRGNLGNLILRLFKELLPEVILNSIILILSIITWVLHYLQKHNKIHTKPSNLWLCLGSVSFILFVMTPTIAMQLLVKNILLQYYMYYILLFLISLFLLNYISDLIKSLDIVVEFYIVVITILVLVLSQVTNTYDFTQSIYVFFVVLSVVFLAIFFKILAIKKKRVIKILSYMYLGFLLGVSINIYVLLNNRSLPQPFLCIQLLLILLLLGNLYYNTKTLVKDIEEIQENNAYREIALKDKLTGLYNRYAFEHDILEIDNNTLEHLGIVSMDINNLKYYNDTLGHLVGDKLIKEAAKLISDVFPQVYRTGGDEFIALITDETIEILDEKKEMLLRKVIKYNKNENNDIIVEIATGYSKYKFGDSSYEQILVRSDAEMYKHKEQLKSRSVIKSVR